MGGLAGHIKHVYEDRTLTIADIFTIVKQACAGTLNNVSEKIDGINLMFTWNDGLKLARNTKDVTTGGMSYADVVARFADRDGVYDVFCEAYSALEQALSALSSQQRTKIFENGTLWRSAEVVFPEKYTNTIHYDVNAIVFHEYPVVSTIDGIKYKRGENVFEPYVNLMNNAMSDRSIVIVSSSAIKLQKIESDESLSESLAAIRRLMNDYCLTINNTIGELYLNIIMQRMIDHGCSTYVAKHVAKRLMNDKDALNVTQLVKLDSRNADYIRDSVKFDKKIYAATQRMLEKAINKSIFDVLLNINSKLIAEPDVERHRLEAKISKIIDHIRSNGGWYAMCALEEQLLRMNTMTIAPIEGIVFTYKNNTYKFTGNFAAIHQVFTLANKCGFKGNL